MNCENLSKFVFFLGHLTHPKNQKNIFIIVFFMLKKEKNLYFWPKIDVNEENRPKIHTFIFY